ncbi:MAG: carbohydrate kinase [Deltaproteobacteria bacterium]|nr:carbohydrate kinase [Deltaproteobacteria bacterium]
MGAHYYIGYDCGTMGTKVAIYTGEGELISEAYREHVILYPKPGWAEMEAEQFYKVVSEGIQECLRKGRVEPGAVKGISCSGIICGFVPIDSNWKPLAPYIPYLDGRAQQEVIDLQNAEPLWAEESGNADVGAYMPPVILKWVLANMPEVRKTARKVVGAAHYVMGKFGGMKADEAFIDWAHQSGWIIGFDARKRDWSERQIKILDLPREILPRVVKPWEVVGELCAKEAEVLGLKPGVPLVAGGGDIMQSCLGSGLTEVGMSFDVAGTASILAFAVKEIDPVITRKKVLVNAMNTFDDQYLLWGFIPAGGLSLRWFRDEIYMRRGDSKVYRELDQLAAQVPPGSDFSLFFPFLQGRSSPFWSTASGTWLGLRGSNQAAHLWRSMLESIAFEYLFWTNILRDEGIEVNRMIGTGGGSNSPLWNQIKADMLDLEYMIPARSEGAVLGNALLAAYGVGDIKDMKKTIKEWVTFQEVYRPNPKATALYERVAKVREEILNGPLLECFDRVQSLHSLER